MKQEQAWRNNSSGSILQYDFAPPPHWTSDRIVAEQTKLATQIDAADGTIRRTEPGWLRLAKELPEQLRGALVEELLAGNHLSGIGRTGWPNEGSIVVKLRERFSTARHSRRPDVVWRTLDDPHYCREELSQTVDSVEFLIIT